MLKAGDLVVRMIDVSIRYPGPHDDACVTLEDDPPCSIVTSTRERVNADEEAAVMWSARAIGVFGVADVPAQDSSRGMAGSRETAGSRGMAGSRGGKLAKEQDFLARSLYVEYRSSLTGYGLTRLGHNQRP